MQLWHIRASQVEQQSMFLHWDRWAQYWAPGCLSYWLPAAVADCLLCCGHRHLRPLPTLAKHFTLSPPRAKPCTACPAWSLCLQLSPRCHQRPGLGELGTGSVSSRAPTTADSLCHLHILMHLKLSLPAAWWGLPPGKGMVLSELLQPTQTGRTCAEV